MDIYKEYNKFIKKFAIVIALSLSLILSYAYLISVIENVDFFTALYFSVITITTTGYGDFTPKTFLGRALTIIYLTFGIGIVMYLFSLITEFIVEGKLKELIRVKRMENLIKSLKDHYIVCGYGKLGRVIVYKLLREGVKVVVIEKDEEKIREALEKYKNFIYIIGDARKDIILKKANIEKAKCLIAALSEDADNVFVTLTAKELNKNILVVAKADEYEAIKKLKAAGADRVVSPYLIGGLRMAELSLRSGLLDFLHTFIKVASDEFDEDVDVKKIKVEEGSELAYKTLSQSQIRKKTGLTVLGVKRGDEIYINPEPTFLIKPGDIIYAFGPRGCFVLLEKKAKGKEGRE
ncbi:potassium channel family protein [Methanocaldococcus infernus]|uniref:TrkA-N domain protein n=1 Tax=Methanocaldococcus infernus (strain DSM 11812 / JCM 15783 / ME) TaxID=573063 RepID=D5VRE7_METIM|nr:potassium channel protein [Methanocaldococcus infernus]ADG13150.1 TrkA-N domain protein [Methanocaldococcus infernus ME]